MAEAVILKSNELAWPTGIANFDARQRNMAQMANYTVFYLTTLLTGQAILFVPAVENSAMPADLAPAFGA